MKSMKKFLTMILVVAMLATLVVLPAGAQTMTDAQKAATLNILRGDSAAGVTTEYLAKSTNRSQGARVLLRLRGLEILADAFTGTTTFSDASDATLFWQPMLAYLKANPNAGFSGYPDGTFLPNKIMTAQELYKVLLVALGYVENVDFTWNQVFAFAQAKGLTKLQGKTNITNNDLAAGMVEALNATKKDGQLLISFLVEENVITVEKAQQAGFNVVKSVEYEAEYLATIGQPVSLPAKLDATLADDTIVEVNVTWSAVNTSTLGIKPVTGTVAGYGTFTTTVNVMPDVLMITDAFPSGTKEITVTLNKPVPQGTAVSLKIGNVTQSATVAFDATRRVMTLSRTWNFTPGTYTVTVGDSSKNLVIEAERLEQIAIGADYIFPMTGQNLKINLLNQYNEPMIISNTTIHVTNISRGTTLSAQIVGTEVTVDASNDTLVRSGDNLMIMVIHNTTAKTAQKQIPVLAKPVIKGLQFGQLEIAAGKTRIEANTSGHKIKLHAVDQYGNPYVLTNADIQPGGTISASTSNTATIDPATFMIDSEGKLIFNTGTAGTANIILIVPTQAVVSTYTVTVVDPAMINMITLLPPSTMMTVAAKAEFNMLAYDQYSNPVTVIGNYDHSKFSMTSTNPGVIANGSFQYDGTKGVLFVYPVGTGTSTVSYYYEGRFMNSMTLTVNEAPKPSTITAVTIPQAFEMTATRVMTLADFTVVDQYGQPFSLTGTSYWIQFAQMGGSTLFTLSGSTVNTTTSITLTANGTTKGTATLRATVFGTAGAITTSIRDTQVEVVAASD
ncbi:MAG: Ig-like domain-containing protein, partial [Clostridia bacterium]